MGMVGVGVVRWVWCVGCGRWVRCGEMGVGVRWVWGVRVGRWCECDVGRCERSMQVMECWNIECLERIGVRKQVCSYPH